MKKLAIALAMCGSLLCSPVQAKTFVGVLWPMFGPLPAIGLVELVAELKAMPDVEVETYVHQAWPSLVEDLKHLPPGTHTLVVGYSLGANSSVFVANNSKFIDTIIALQPSMLSWNPEVTGKVGHYIEIYNPNPWETFGGMGSKKLVGPNIEYIANNDSHPGAQFDPQFRDLVKSEVAKLVAQDRDEDRDNAVETAQAAPPKPVEVAAAQQPVEGQIIDLHRDAAIKDRAPAAPAKLPNPAEVAVAAASPIAPEPDTANAQSRQEQSRQEQSRQDTQQDSQAATPPPAAGLEQVADERLDYRPGEAAPFLDTLTGAVDSGALFGDQKPAAKRRLTVADMVNYAKRTYGASHGQRLPGGVITTASVAFDR